MVMARTLLIGGQTFGVAPGSVVNEIIGTNENETINVLANAKAFFDGSFNRGGDVITLAGNAATYTATIVGGSRLVLTSTNGTEIDIPVGGVGVTINFGDAADRSLRFDAAGNMLLGSQTIAAVGPTTIAAGTGDPDPEPNPSGDPIYLTTSSDRGGDFNGTSGNDEFIALLGQNPFLGGVSNTLASGDVIRGGAGQDSLYAQLVPEFVGGTAPSTIDVQPTLNSIERIDLEVRDRNYNLSSGYSGSNDDQTVYFDAKYVTGHVRIGSKQSDGDLVIENLTTLASNGTTARNTEDITITMDHTDNFNSDGDASDLFVFFDDDYLLAGQSRTTSQANYWLLDEDSPDYVNEPLANIERNGVSLTIDGTPVSIEITTSIAAIPDTWEGYAAALQTRINQMIAAGTTILQGITVTVDWNNTDATYNDFGNLVTIPAITLIDANGRELVPTGYLIPEGASGSFDIFGRFDNDPSEALDNPITVNIELHKVGRAGEGGDMIVGGKNGDKGIEVFNVSVLGAGDKPSSLGTLASNGGDLAEVYIKTDAAFVNGATHASLEIRDGFGDNLDYDDDPSYPGSTTPNDMRLVDADAFLGDLLLGTSSRIVNLDTLKARGGGDVEFYGTINGNEANQPYSYLTGAGDDVVDVTIDGDAVDFAQSSLTIDTGAGNDDVTVSFNLTNSGEIINQAILKNVSISTGDGNDVVSLGNMSSVQPGYGNAEIRTGSGNDEIYTSGGVKGTTWAFNYDDALVIDRAGSLAGWATGPRGLDDLPGVQTSLQYLGGATVRVALSAAGVGTLADGGGVGVYAGADSLPAGGYVNGFEKSVTIGNALTNGRKYFGDQRDINAAVIDAINNDPVLSKLLFAALGPNNTLQVTTLTGGEFQQDDLEITVSHRNWQSTQTASEILAEARAITGNSALVDADLWGAGPYTASTVYNPTGAAATGGLLDLTVPANADTYYTGLGVDNADLALATGEESLFETDNLINAGSGDDLIVLSTDAVGWSTGAAAAFTVSSNNAHWNGASNETVQMDGVFASRVGDTIVNFSTAFGTATPTGLGAAGAAQTTFLDGMDFLDFSSYLTSQEDKSVNTPSAPDSNVSHHQIAVTLQADTLGVNANEVAVIKFTASGNATWDGLSNAVIESLFNTHTGAINYGSFNDAAFTANDEYAENVAAGTDDLVGAANSAKAIVMVENTANLGEYRVFELSWNGNASADPNDANMNGVVTAREIGDLDFGTTLVGMHEVNLVGSASYNSLLGLGFFDPGYVASNTTVLA